MLYPCDAVSAERLVALMAYHPGPAYMRTSRPKTPVIYANDETFTIGGLKVLRESADDVATVIGAGVTVFEALKAYDQLKAAGIAIRVIDLYSVPPVDQDGARRRGTRDRRPPDHRRGSLRGRRHRRRGGGGGGRRRASRVHRLAVREIPRSGKPEELLDRFGISASTSSRRCRAQ